MAEFIKAANNQSAIRKSEIVTVKYGYTRSGVTITFKLKSGEEIYWFDRLEAEAKQIIENL